MEFHGILFELAVIFGGAALMATLFVFLKQPIIISYIVLGMIVGPFGFGVIGQADHIEKISHLGIVLLLFLVGLNLHLHKLVNLFKKTVLVTGATSFIFFVVFGGIALAAGFGIRDSLVVGAALMFSSTIVGLKLVPTTTLHQRHLGEVMVSTLLLQDILAIFLIIVLESGPQPNLLVHIPRLLAQGAVLAVGSYLLFKYVIVWLFRRFDTIQEYVLVVALGWCLTVAGCAKMLGMSYEIGAFIGGCAFAQSPVALIISERLKSLREFFLILFFFATGTQLDMLLLKDVLVPGLALALAILILKPVAFKKAFGLSREEPELAVELGFRLGQGSEFSLLVAVIALSSSVISARCSSLIQLTTIVTLIVSTYLVSFKYPTPIGVSKTLRGD